MATSHITKSREIVKTEVTFSWNSTKGYFACTPTVPGGKNIWQVAFAPFAMNNTTWALRSVITPLVSGNSWLIYPPSGTTFAAGTTITTYAIWF